MEYAEEQDEGMLLKLQFVHTIGHLLICGFQGNAKYY